MFHGDISILTQLQRNAGRVLMETSLISYKLTCPAPCQPGLSGLQLFDSPWAWEAQLLSTQAPLQFTWWSVTKLSFQDPRSSTAQQVDCPWAVDPRMPRIHGSRTAHYADCPRARTPCPFLENFKTLAVVPNQNETGFPNIKSHHEMALLFSAQL